MIVRQLRNLVSRLKLTRKSLVVFLLWPDPEELEDEVFLMELAPPEVPQLEQILDRLVAGSQIRVDLTPLGREKILQAALGLSANQARRVFGKAIVAEVRDGLGRVLKPAGCLDERGIDMIMAEKKAIVRESGALEFYSPEETLADVGLEVLRSGSVSARSLLPGGSGLWIARAQGDRLTGSRARASRRGWWPVCGTCPWSAWTWALGGWWGDQGTPDEPGLVETISPCLLDRRDGEGLRLRRRGRRHQPARLPELPDLVQEKRKPVFVIGTASKSRPARIPAQGALTRSSS